MIRFLVLVKLGFLTLSGYGFLVRLGFLEVYKQKGNSFFAINCSILINNKTYFLWLPAWSKLEKDDPLPFEARRCSIAWLVKFGY